LNDLKAYSKKNLKRTNSNHLLGRNLSEESNIGELGKNGAN